MGILRRLFSLDHRKAVTAEAQGDFLTAAKHYALCGDRHRVADMHLAQARAEGKVEGRVRCLRSALVFLPVDDERRPMVLRLLGRSLREKAASDPCEAEERRQLLEEAGQMLEAGESWEAAGDCYLELQDPTRAANAYAKAGLLERVEEVLSRQEHEVSRARREASSFRDFELQLQGGQRREAAESLRRCIEAATEKGEYRRLLTELEQQFLAGGRLELETEGRRLVVIGRFPVRLGREIDCELQVRGAGVSRHHARVELEQDRLLVRDCESRNGTSLDGLRIGGPLPLPASGTLGLGDDCQIDIRLQAGPPPLIRLEVMRGLDRGAVAVASLRPLRLQDWLCQAPDLELRFDNERPLARALSGALTLNGAAVGREVQLIRGDELTLAGRSARVVG